MRLKLYALLLLCFLAKNTKAADIESTATGGDWNAEATWAGGVIPSSSDNVTIKSGAYVCANVIGIDGYHEHNANLIIEIDAELQVKGDGLKLGGALTIFLNNGYFTSSNLLFKGSGPQRIRGVAQSLSGNIIIDNTNNVSLQSDAIQSCDNLILTNGRLRIFNNAFLRVEGNVTGYTSTKNVRMEAPTARLELAFPAAGTKIAPLSTTTSYNPAEISTANPSVFAVGLIDGFLPTTPLATPGKVEKQWLVESVGGPALPYNLKLFWSPAHEDLSFNSGSCAIANWNTIDSYWQAEQMNAEAPSVVSAGQRTRTLTATTATGNFTVVSGSSLPVELALFQGTEKGLYNTFRWTTLTEENSARHILERWVKEDNSWISIGSTRAHGTTTEIHNYAIEDKNPIGAGYYRLRLEDTDGRFQYSKTILIKRKSDLVGTVATYPNPFKDEISVAYKLPKLADKGQITVIDQFGKSINIYNVTPDNELIRLNLSDLQEGIYYIQMTADNGAVVTQKIIKQ